MAKSYNTSSKLIAYWIVITKREIIIYSNIPVPNLEDISLINNLLSLTVRAECILLIVLSSNLISLPLYLPTEITETGSSDLIITSKIS